MIAASAPSAAALAANRSAGSSQALGLIGRRRRRQGDAAPEVDLRRRASNSGGDRVSPRASSSERPTESPNMATRGPRRAAGRQRLVRRRHRPLRRQAAEQGGRPSSARPSTTAVTATMASVAVAATASRPPDDPPPANRVLDDHGAELGERQRDRHERDGPAPASGRSVNWSATTITGQWTRYHGVADPAQPAQRARRWRSRRPARPATGPDDEQQRARRRQRQQAAPQRLGSRRGDDPQGRP